MAAWTMLVVGRTLGWRGFSRVRSLIVFLIVLAVLGLIVLVCVALHLGSKDLVIHRMDGGVSRVNLIDRTRICRDDIRPLRDNATTVEIRSPVTEIAAAAFSGCEFLTSVTLPSSVTNIGKYAFLRCESLTSIIIPSNVTEIGEAAFAGCESLTSVKIPSDVTEIRDSSFQGCKSLASVVIPHGVRRIGSRAFEGCKSLVHFTIPEGVVEIGENAFPKTKEEELAEKCERLAIERMSDAAGGIDIWELYAWRNSTRLRYDGIETFVANFERAVSPIPDKGARTRAIVNAPKHRELYEKFLCASSALVARGHDPRGKDEYESNAEYKVRCENEKRKTAELSGKRKDVLDEIVAFELSCSPNINRCATSGFYAMKEALIFIPETDWKYDAETRLFRVKGREIKDDGAGRGLYDFYGELNRQRTNTMQWFHFSVNGIPIVQFVKSETIDYEYEVANDAWEHPRLFKGYKQECPFLLVHLGACDFKVQGHANRIATMPWNRENREDRNFVSGTSGGVDSSERESVLRRREIALRNREKRDRIMAAFRKPQREQPELRFSLDPLADYKFGEPLFTVKTFDGSSAAETLIAARIYADYATSKGRAEIERVLEHFEKIGGSYYREFGKAVRLAMKGKAMTSDVKAEMR